MFDDPRKKGREPTRPNGPDKAGLMFEEMMQDYIVTTGWGLSVAVKSLFTRWMLLTVGSGIGLWYVAEYVALNGWHLHWLDDCGEWVMQKTRFLYDYPVPYHAWFLWGCAVACLLPIIGTVAKSVRSKYDKLFRMIGMTNGLGDTPKLVFKKKLGDHRRLFCFDPNGISLKVFENHQDALEAHFRASIESIEANLKKGLIDITVSTLKLPDELHYLEAKTKCRLPRGGFYLGQGAQGIETQCIADLPHMLIAGTTGGGKSIFLKQALMGLLESEPHLQMYLADLKGGLEMADFLEASNVRVVKTMPDAVRLLGLVEVEMKQRFEWLSKENKRHIVPERDGWDRIVTVVDEASVLYMSRPRSDPEYELAIEARRLADSIAKLSRAASIHLIVATQKLDKQVIPTSVSENISGRMAFRSNSLQGSLVVLGTKDAYELPETPGRGIWSCGQTTITLQAPFIDEDTIRSRCLDLKEKFEQGRRSLQTQMLIERSNERSEPRASILPSG